MGALKRIGTTYLPVQDVKESANWYEEKLDVVINYLDDEKAIVDMANQSFFLVKAELGETSNFIDYQGKEHFSCTFEVDGLRNLEEIHKRLLERGVPVGEIENRGHAGRNFVFSDLNGNKFDVWSELSPDFKRRYK
ncbi:VOC family protein [Ornithinibacillus halophilus]|uniref:VOC domain-containing protein n=1 Tax=Ornithinibacillus halophilus TaxID=930117 RepID=A0A1M5HQV0_9BACI|nr:VOC family protein [Ornithinibacillus halophilus]SHG18344.1 hypothetical protein SAMN05216225_101915 [Ornithinibacillus halophilus]